MGKNFDDVQEFCHMYGGDLPSIHSEEENQEIKSLTGGHEVWLGLIDTAPAEESGPFAWIDETPFDYENWTAGEPNNWKDQEDCVTMQGPGTWNDAP